MEFGYTTLALPVDVRHQQRHRGQVLVNVGTGEQKQAVAAAAGAGGVVASFALTEAGAGSDPSGLQHQRPGATAKAGSCSPAPSGSSPTRPLADLFVVFARTEPQARGTRGIAVFLVAREPARRQGRPEGREDGPGGRLDLRGVLRSTSGSGVRAGRRQAEEIGYRRGHDGHWSAAGCTSPPSAVGMRRAGCWPSRWRTRASRQGGRPIGEFQLVQAMLADQNRRATRAGPWSARLRPNYD